MGFFCSDAFLDVFLDELATCTAINACTAEPTSIAECDSLSVVPAHTLTGGDFTNANGDTSGRKTTVAAQSSLSVDATGSITHVAINDGTSFYVVTCTSKDVTSGDTLNIPEFDIEIADPVAA